MGDGNDDNQGDAEGSDGGGRGKYKAEQNQTRRGSNNGSRREDGAVVLGSDAEREAFENARRHCPVTMPLHRRLFRFCVAHTGCKRVGRIQSQEWSASPRSHADVGQRYVHTIGGGTRQVRQVRKGEWHVARFETQERQADGCTRPRRREVTVPCYLDKAGWSQSHIDHLSEQTPPKTLRPMSSTHDVSHLAAYNARDPPRGLGKSGLLLDRIPFFVEAW